MREIKFRGKRADNGEWVYGYLVVKAGMPFIFSFGVIEPILVIPETIGQYTGLKDKNGVEIYEGDIICVEDEMCIEHTIVWDEDYSAICIKMGGDESEPIYDYDLSEWEVIGNIHDGTSR